MEDHDRSKKYGRLCLRLPTLISNNGLCQTLAFLEAKGAAIEKKPEYKNLMGDLAVATGDATNWEEYANLARTSSGSSYIRLTAEALRCSLYFKRYAEAVLRVDLTQGDDDE
jgi:CRISPR-associated protein Cmr5